MTMHPDDQIRYDKLDRLIDAMMQERFMIVPDEEEDQLLNIGMLLRTSDDDVPHDLRLRIDRSVRMKARAQRNIVVIKQERRQNRVRNAKSPPSWRRMGIIWGSLVATLLISVLVVIRAAADSRPGQPLYTIVAVAQAFSVSLAADQQNKAEITLNYLSNALVILQMESTDGSTQNDLNQALQVVVQKDSDAQKVIDALPVGTAHIQYSAHFAQLQSQERQVLRILVAGKSGWPLRLAASKQLGKLGEAVPMITNVAVVTVDGHYLITITGNLIRSGAVMVINGGGSPTPLAVGDGQAIATIATVPSNAWTIGVINADGIAAEYAAPPLSIPSAKPTPTLDPTPKKGKPTPFPTPATSGEHTSALAMSTNELLVSDLLMKRPTANCPHASPRHGCVGCV